MLGMRFFSSTEGPIHCLADDRVIFSISLPTDSIRSYRLVYCLDAQLASLINIWSFLKEAYERWHVRSRHTAPPSMKRLGIVATPFDIGVDTYSRRFIKCQECVRGRGLQGPVRGVRGALPRHLVGREPCRVRSGGGGVSF